MSPTIYEVSQNPTLQESAYRSLNAIVSKPDHIVSQLLVQRDVICSLWTNDSAHKIVQIVEEQSSKGSPLYLEHISIAVIRSYLNALLCLNKLDRFFAAASEILQKYDGYDFAQTVRDLSADVAYPKLTQLISDKLSMDESAGGRDLTIYLREAKPLMLMILNIASFCKVPDFMSEKLAKTLEVMDKNVQLCLKRLTDTKQGFQESVKFSKEFVQDFNTEKERYKASEAEDEQETPFQVQARKILQRFINNK